MSAEYRRRGRIEGCSYYLLPDVSVEHSAAIGNVHRLDSMETTAVLGRVVEFVDLRDRPSHNGTAFEVPAAALARALESAPERDPDLESSEFGRRSGRTSRRRTYDRSTAAAMRSSGASCAGSIPATRGSGSSSRAGTMPNASACAQRRPRSCSKSCSRICRAPSVSQPRPESARSARAERDTHGPAGTSWRCAAAA